MSMSSGNGSAGGEIPSRYGGMTSSIPNQTMQDRRPRRNNTGGKPGYYNNPRGDNRMNYRNNRGGSGGTGNGDGVHNNNTGSGYRGGNDYDNVNSGPPMANGERSGGHMHPHPQQGGGNHQYHQYSQQQQQHHHHHHHHNQNKNLDYDGMSSRPPRSGNHHHHNHNHVDRSNVIGMHHQETHMHVQHPPPQAFVAPAGGTGSHHSIPTANEIVIVQQDHHFKGQHVAAPMGPFQAPPQSIQAPVGFFAQPQPAMPNTIVMVSVPYGMNPASVIASGIQTQVIGTGFLNPTLQFACAVPSQLIPSQPLIFQQPQQHFAPHHQPHFQQVIGAPPPQLPAQNGTDDAGNVLFDATAILNPDANAFFPTMTSFSEEVDEDEGHVSGGGDVTSPQHGHGSIDDAELPLLEANPKPEIVVVMKQEVAEDCAKDSSLEKSGGGEDLNGSGNKNEGNANTSTD